MKNHINLVWCLGIPALAIPSPQDTNNPGGSSLAKGPNLDFTEVHCDDPAAKNATAPGMIRWQSVHAQDAWDYIRSEWLTQDGSKPRDVEFPSIAISDFFHGLEGMTCGNTGLDDDGCKNTVQCDDGPKGDNIKDGHYPAGFMILNSMTNLNGALRQLWYPLEVRTWTMTNLTNIQNMLDVFVNGVDAVAANNKALALFQFIMTSVLSALFGAGAAVANPAGGAGLGVLKDVVFAGIAYAVSRAKEDFAARQVKEGTGEEVISAIATTIVAGFKGFNKFIMGYQTRKEWDANADEAQKTVDSGLDLLGDWINYGKFLPNEFKWDSNFGDNFMQHMLTGTVIPHLWRLSPEQVRPTVLATGESCNDPRTDYGGVPTVQPPEGDNLRPYFEPDGPESQASLEVCYKGKRYYLVGATGNPVVKIPDPRFPPPGPHGSGGPFIDFPESFSELLGANKLTDWGLSKEGLVESAVEGLRLWGSNDPSAHTAGLTSKDGFSVVWDVMKDMDLSRAHRLPGIVGIPVCTVDEARDGWLHPDNDVVVPCPIVTEALGLIG